MALWLWATVDGVGSARRLDQLCREHLAYRWLCGGVSMNYHTLSDFRIAHTTVLDRLLANGVASLVQAGLVQLDTLAQDGLRVRASAGAASFRRRRRLDELRVAAQARVVRLRAELEGDPAAGDRRQRAAQERAAREREARIAAAQERMGELEAERARREKTNKAQVAKQKEPRASTTDAQARVMKMADGGYRPAYNMQIVSEPNSQIDCCGRRRDQRFGSRLGATSSRDFARQRSDTIGLSGGRRVRQELRHRVGACQRHAPVVSARADPAWNRSLCAQAR